MSDYQIESREWWVQRWLELLDSYRFKKRLERARIYAREGNVLSIDFKGSQVLAKVQGSEPQPYQVSLSLAPFSDEDWRFVIESLSQKAVFSAQLLAGEMPANIEEVFTANGLSLFPFTLSDIRSRCSCPDKANPCKHIGAVYYQLADRLSEDPFVFFQLRGRTKAQILESLRQLRTSTKKVEGETKPEKNKERERSSVGVQEVVNLERFWQYDEPLESALVAIVPPAEKKSILELLATIPLAYEEAQSVEQYLQQAYQMASQQATIEALNRDI